MINERLLFALDIITLNF